MNTVFKELDIKQTYYSNADANKADNKNFDFNISGFHFISIFKNGNLVRRFYTVEKHDMCSAFSTTGVVTYYKPKAVHGLDYVDPFYSKKYHRISRVNKETWTTEYRNIFLGSDKIGVCRDEKPSIGATLKCIGGGRIMDHYNTDAKISNIALAADTALVYQTYKIKPNGHSKNKMYDNKDLYSGGIHFRPIRHNKGKFKVSEVNYSITKNITKIDLL